MEVSAPAETRNAARAMSKVFIINGHQRYAFAKGELNAALVERARTYLAAAGCEIENDLVRFKTHLNSIFPCVNEADHVAA